jgi:nucleoid-associated protein YgaU
VTEALKTEPEVPAAGQQATTGAEQPAKAEEPAPGQTAETNAPAVQQETAQQSQDTVAATAQDATAATPKEGRIVIQPGNNLWRISRVLYGTGNKFTMLYEANKDQIRNPNLIYPGQVFRTPEVAAKANTIDPHRRNPLTPEESAGSAQ